MGLIARQLEESGIPTVVLTSARDITMAVNPPRAVFLDYPLGHTSGRPDQPALNKEIVGAALGAFAQADRPGWIHGLPHRWDTSDDWKDAVLRPTTNGADDDRTLRLDSPQYQSEQDANTAALTHGGEECQVCKGVDY